MKKLLAKADQRIVDILEYIDKNETPMQYELSEILHVTQNTMRKDLAQINKIFDFLVIDIHANGGITLTIQNNYSFENIYKYMYSYSNELLLLDEIFTQTHTVASLSEELFVSKSTLRRMIAMLNTVFEDVEMKIQCNPVKLVGDEVTIRKFMAVFFLDKYSRLDNMLDDAYLWNFNQIFSAVIKDSSLVNIVVEERLKIETYVSIVRHKQGYHLKQKDIVLAQNKDVFLERLFEHTFDMPLTESTYTDVFQMLLCLINIENCKTVAQLKETSANINKILTNYGIFIDMLSLNVPFPSESKENILKQLYAYHILYVHDFATLDTDFEFKVEKTVRGYPKLIDYIDTFLKSSEWYEPFCF